MEKQDSISSRSLTGSGETPSAFGFHVGAGFCPRSDVMVLHQPNRRAHRPRCAAPRQRRRLDTRPAVGVGVLDDPLPHGFRRVQINAPGIGNAAHRGRCALRMGSPLNLRPGGDGTPPGVPGLHAVAGRANAPLRNLLFLCRGFGIFGRETSVRLPAGVGQTSSCIGLYSHFERMMYFGNQSRQ